MSTLSVQLFNKLCLRCNGQLLDSPEGGKAQELLCYLLLYRARPHARETLAGLLWDDTSEEQSRKYLRKALWQLQSVLQPYGEPGIGQVLLVDHEWLHINPNTDLWLDVAEFEQAFGQVQGVRGRELNGQSLHTLKDAVELYKGDLLEGWYQDWCLYERKRLQNMYLTMLDKLMGYCETHQVYENGVDYGMRILHYDYAQERIHQRLMRLHYLAGDRVAALRQYDRCVAALEEEFGVKPSRRTRALYAQIRADQLDESLQAQVEAKAIPLPVSNALNELKQVWMMLLELERQVLDDIQVIERTIEREH